MFPTPLSPSKNDTVSQTDFGSTWWLVNTNEQILQSWQNPCAWIAVKVPGYFKLLLFSTVTSCAPSIWGSWVCFGGRCCSPFCYFKLRASKGVMERGEIWTGNGVNGVKKKKKMENNSRNFNFHTIILKSCRNCSRWISKLHSLLLPAHVNAMHEHEDNWNAVATQL